MKLVAVGFLSIGIFLLVQIVAPIVSFEIWQIGQSFESNLISPQKPSETSVLGVSIENKDNFPGFISNFKRETQPNYTKFSLSIPRLNIEKQIVLVDSNDLSKSLDFFESNFSR